MRRLEGSRNNLERKTCRISAVGWKIVAAVLGGMTSKMGATMVTEDSWRSARWQAEGGKVGGGKLLEVGLLKADPRLLLEVIR